ncbi:MAG: VOC family protein [Candidatus Sulfotelmatobacter sp.]
MPKRSLNPGPGDTKKIEQLNKAVEAMLARADGKPPKMDKGIEPLVRVAAELRNLPSASFKARLKSQLQGEKKMATLTVSTTATPTPVPAARPSAAPRLTFKDAAKAIEFYKTALGAKENFRFETPSGIPHAEIQIGNSIIMLTEEWPEGDRFSAETIGRSPVWLSLDVPDVDSFAERAARAGMTIVRPPADQFYGRRDATLTDPFGYTWAVSMLKEELSEEEMHRRMQGLTHGPEGGQMAKKSAGVNPVPKGFRMVTPYLVAENGLALLDFAKAAFAAEELERIIMPTGGVHGETRIGDSVLMMGGGTPGHKHASTLHPQALHVYVQDADAVCQKAVAAGATLIDAPRDQEYGERSGTVKDQAGNFWYIATAKGESYVPQGLHNVNPYLHPLRAEPFIGFLKRAFGALEIAKYASPDGVVHHAVVGIGDSVIEMGEAQGKYERMPAMFYLYVPDCDALYHRALAAGAKSLHQPTDQPYGDRNSAVTDAFGNIWYIATHIKDVAM